MSSTAKSMLWAGRVLSGLSIMFLLFDCIIHIMNLPMVTEAFTQLGYNPSVALPLGIVELICLVLYVVPRTSVLGAILLTGYLGGAVATHVRVGDPLFSHILFPVYVGIFVWGGLFLRNQKLREVIWPKK